jgi:hypothetical protein
MLTKKQISERAKLVRSEVAKAKSYPLKGSIADYCVFVACYVEGNYQAAHATKLYNNHGGEYCEAVAVNSRLRWIALERMQVQR